MLLLDQFVGINISIITVALFHENDEPINQLAYSVSAKTINILNTVLPDNKIVQKSEYVINDMYNVTRVGKNDNNVLYMCIMCILCRINQNLNTVPISWVPTVQC